MAIRAEENAGAFYRRAADLHKDKADVAFLLRLAEMEDWHKITFEKMQTELAAVRQERGAYQPDDEAARYLDALADASVSEGSPQLADSLTDEESMEDILKAAIEMEKDAVLFYLGLADAVPEELGRDSVKEVIKQEQSHVATLTNELRRRSKRLVKDAPTTDVPNLRSLRDRSAPAAPDGACRSR